MNDTSAAEQIRALQAEKDALAAQLAGIPTASDPRLPLPGSSHGMEMHGNIEALFEAIAKATAEFGDVTKSKEGQTGHQKFKYATLAMLTEATRAPLAKAGVSVTQAIVDSEDPSLQMVVQMVVGHGGRILYRMSYPRPSDIKEVGRASTYARRYLYQAAFVIDGGEDVDNGNTDDKPKKPRPNGQPRQTQAPSKRARPSAKAASGEVAPPGRQAPEVKAADPKVDSLGDSAKAPPAQSAKPTDQQNARLREQCEKLGLGGIEANALSKKVTGSSPEELTHEGAEKLIAYLAERLQEAGK